MSRFLLFFSLVCVLQADQVVLKNGDTITGKIIQKDGSKLTIKSEFLGEVTMPWTAVKTVRSDENLTVELPGGVRAAGSVATNSEGALVVSTPTGVRVVGMDTVGAMRDPDEEAAWERLQHPSLLQLWSGSLDTGLALARGNADTDTLTTTVSATRVTTTDKIIANFNQIYGTARLDGVYSAVASAAHGDWEYNHNITPKFFVATLNSYDHNRFQDLDLRFVAGGGLGWNAVKNDRANLTITGGGDYDREAFSGAPTRNSAEAYFGDSLTYKFSSASSLTQNLQIFPNLSETGQYRSNMNLSIVTALKKWLGWHVTASDNFLSNPVLGRQRNDLLLSTGLRLTFAH
jgi:putative salt-induced outer membrane protein YdiY